MILILNHDSTYFLVVCISLTSWLYTGESQTLIRKLEFELGSDKDLIQQQEKEIKSLHQRLRESENACYNMKNKHTTYVKEINKNDESQVRIKADI